MASTPRATWQRAKHSLAHQVTADLTPQLDAVRSRLDALEAALTAIERQLRELHEIAVVQTEVANESTELLGRLLRSATERIDALEEQAAAGR